MATAVTLVVTPPAPVDPDGRNDLPSDIASLLTAAGQSWGGALSGSGDGAWRFNLRIRGRERLDVARQLERDVRSSGPDSFTFTAYDGSVTSAAATVALGAPAG